MINLIEAQELMKKFHGREAVKGINLAIRQGEILALIGTNGAGKSTTIAMLMGILEPDAGSVTRWRRDYQGYVGLQLQSTPFFEGFTVEENLLLFAALYDVQLTRDQINKKLEECGLIEAKKTPAIRLSIGQQKRLAIAITTIHDPELVVLDEPTAGLDPLARYEIREMIRKFADANVTVLFSSHDMDEVMQIADRLVFMQNGEIIAQGIINDLLKEHQVDDLDTLYIKLTQKSIQRG